MTRASIQRSATFCWSPRNAEGLRTPLLAAGSSADALDETFSNESTLEIWDPLQSANQQPVLKGSIKLSARFTSIAWGFVKEAEYPKGVIAAGFEDGELGIYDPVKILASASTEDSLIWSNKEMHTGAVRAIGFNPSKPNVLATGASNGEIWIWDISTPGKPFSPGTRSRNLEDVTSLAWNPQHESILATSSSSGYTVVWDLRTKREFVTLAAPQGPMPGQNGNSMQQNWMNPAAAGRRGASCVAWHPEIPSSLAVASENDMTPVVFMWDLRNPREPERTLTGHEKGILSMEWSVRDPDLLITCGKDSRTICWNPITGTIIGELARSTNWSFRAQICPQVPDLVAVGSFDGSIGIHSLQATRSEAEIQAERPAGADIFDVTNLNTQSYPAVSLSQAPKWLKRPVSATFGFGGKLVIVQQLKHKAPAPGAAPQPLLSTVSIRTIASEQKLVQRVNKLEKAKQEADLAAFCESQLQAASTPAKDEAAKGKPAVSWQLLAALFKADSKEELVSLLGFSKEEVKSKVEEAIRSYKSRASLHHSSSEIGLTEASEGDSGSVAREPLVTFADTPTDGLSASSEGEAAAAGTSTSARSETSFSNMSESTKQAPESDITEPSLFGDDAAPAQTQQQNNQATLDFYSSIRSGRPAALPDYLAGEATRGDSSVAATIGSRPSSAASNISVKPNMFKIYPTEESDSDRLITRALVLGDFTSAVSLCLSLDRYADALLLAVRGGPELLAKTQKAYFERQTIALPYLRLFQSIVSNDLSDIVQNAELPEWQEIFVVLCTFAKAEEFAGLVEQLGQRLEYQYTLSARSDTPNLEYRKHAVLCYLAARKLEKVVAIWLEEMREDEAAIEAPKSSAHAQALQTLIEKVTVFQSATNYSDIDLAQPTNSEAIAQSGARTYKLASLYDLYREYAEILAAQGLLSSALAYIALTPKDYEGTESPDVDPTSVRARLQAAAGGSNVSTSKAKASSSAAANRPQTNGYSAPSVPSSNPFNATGNLYSTPASLPPAPPQQQMLSQQMPNQSSFMTALPSNLPPSPQNPYAAQGHQPFGNQAQQSFANQPNQGNMPPMQAQQQQQLGAYGAPSQQQMPDPYGPSQQMATGAPYGPGSSNFAPPPTNSSPPKKYTADGGWNDAPPPSASTIKRAPSAARNQIASPFPNMAPPMPSMPGQPTSGNVAPPPSRAAAASPAPPPPRQNFGPPPARSSSRAGAPPPRNALSPPPPQQQQQQRQPTMPLMPQQQQYGMPPPPFNNNNNAPQPPMQPPQFGDQQGYSAPTPPGPPQQFANMLKPSPAPSPAPRQPIAKPEPPKPKYPAGDRSHIPADSMPIFETCSQRMLFIRQNTPVQQKKMVDDTERRLNVLYDGLNCETLSKTAVDGLNEIVQAIRNSDPNLALDLHLQLLQSGVTDIFMPALKILCRSA